MEKRARSARLDRWVSGLLGRAGVGAGVTVLVGVLPVVGLVAPAIGGGVASWTDNADGVDRGGRVGAAAGALVALFSLPAVFVAVALAASVSPAATVGVLALALLGAVYVVGSAALGGHLVDEAMAERASSEAASAPVERVKRRYVDGEIGEAEFERRLERVIEADRRQASRADRERAGVESGSDRGSRREGESERRGSERRERDVTGRER